MRHIHLILICVLVALFTLASPSLNAQGRFEYDSTWSEWNFRAAPYLWLLGIKGEIIRPPGVVQLPNFPPLPENPIEPEGYDIDIGFREVRNSLKFAIMLSGQFKKEWFVTQFNVSSFVIESEAITPYDYILQNNFINLAYAGGDLDVGYRIIRSKKFEFDALIGVKFVYTRIGISTDLLGETPLEGVRDQFWADPVIGTNLVYRPLPRFEIMVYGDIGSTLLNNDLTYQFSGNVNFLLTKHIYFSAGYKDYYGSIPKEKAIFNGRLSGMIIRIGAQF